MTIIRSLCRTTAQTIVVASAVALGCVAVCPSAYSTVRESTVVSDNEEPEVTVKGQYIYVTTQRALTLRLYSILGQLITQQSVQAGTTRLKAPARGVYILKAGSVTRRVTVNT